MASKRSAEEMEGAAPPAPKVGAGVAARAKIEEEYKNWVVSAPMLYDVCMQKHLKWPSLTVEWLPGFVPAETEGWFRHSLVLGTHTDGSAANEVLLATVDLPG